MASKFSLILCIFAIWAIDFQSASSTRNAPAPSADCSTVVLTMADCLPFVSNGSTITKPEGGCCNGLKTVLKTSPTCLCEALKSSAQFGVALNVTKAVTLPAACNLASPPLSNCGLPGLPGAGAGAAAPGVSNSPPSPPNAEAPSASTPGQDDTSTESADPPSGKSAASALIPISAGSLLVCIFSLFSGL